MNEVYSKSAYVGSLISKKKIVKSASGGIARALSEHIILNGGVVFGVSYDSTFKSAIYQIVNNLDDLDKISGTKYLNAKLQINTGSKLCSVFSVVVDYLKCNIIVLFFGTGCVIKGLMEYCSKEDVQIDSLFTVDLICHGPVNNVAHNAYIQELEKRYKSSVVAFNVKCKEKGWLKPLIKIEFKNGKVYRELWSTSIYAYAMLNFPSKKCSNCKYKGDNHPANLTIGDYWGVLETMDSYCSNGVSVIIVNDHVGEELLSSISNSEFRLFAIDINKAAINNPMYYRSKKYNERLEEFRNNITEIGLKQAVYRELSSNAWKFRLKRIVKNLFI